MGNLLNNSNQEYFSLIEKLKELALEVSSDEENDDVQYLPPLKVLNFLARRLTSALREKPAAPVNITDNPTFSFDEYDVIPGQYLNNNRPSVVAKYLLPKRGSLGNIKSKVLATK